MLFASQAAWPPEMDPGDACLCPHGEGTGSAWGVCGPPCSVSPAQCGGSRGFLSRMRVTYQGQKGRHVSGSLGGLRKNTQHHVCRGGVWEAGITPLQLCQREDSEEERAAAGGSRGVEVRVHPALPGDREFLEGSMPGRVRILFRQMIPRLLAFPRTT